MPPRSKHNRRSKASRRPEPQGPLAPVQEPSISRNTGHVSGTAASAPPAASTPPGSATPQSHPHQEAQASGSANDSANNRGHVFDSDRPGDMWDERQQGPGELCPHCGRTWPGRCPFCPVIVAMSTMSPAEAEKRYKKRYGESLLSYEEAARKYKNIEEKKRAETAREKAERERAIQEKLDDKVNRKAQKQKNREEKIAKLASNAKATAEAQAKAAANAAVATTPAAHPQAENEDDGLTQEERAALKKGKQTDKKTIASFKRHATTQGWTQFNGQVDEDTGGW